MTPCTSAPVEGLPSLIESDIKYINWSRQIYFFKVHRFYFTRDNREEFKSVFEAEHKLVGSNEPKNCNRSFTLRCFSFSYLKILFSNEWVPVDFVFILGNFSIATSMLVSELQKVEREGGCRPIHGVPVLPFYPEKRLVEDPSHFRIFRSKPKHALSFSLLMWESKPTSPLPPKSCAHHLRCKFGSTWDDEIRRILLQGRYNFSWAWNFSWA